MRGQDVLVAVTDEGSEWSGEGGLWAAGGPSAELARSKERRNHTVLITARGRWGVRDVG